MKQTILKNHLFHFLVITQLLVLLLLFWNAQNNVKQFEQYHQRISEHTRQSVSSEVDLLLSNLKTELTILVTENPDLVAKLAADPENDKLISNINLKLGNYFPDFFAVTVAKSNGEILTDDFGEKVGDLCRSDLNLFSRTPEKYAISIHPHASQYHFDIMVPWQIDNEQYSIQEGLFFVSFSLDSLANIIKITEVPGHKTYLLHQQFNNLIEVTSGGGRDVLDGVNYIDKSDEKQILKREKINATLWEVVDFPTQTLLDNYRTVLLKENIKIFVGFSIFVLFVFLIIQREEKRRKVAEQSLLQINQDLSQIVEKKTRDLQKFFRAIEQTSDSTIITNNNGVIEYVNEAFISATGYSRDELIGNTCQMIKSDHHDKEFYRDMWTKLVSGKAFHSVFINRHKNGSFFHEDKTITPIIDEKNKTFLYVGTGRDITDKIKHEEELSYLAHHDILTGLPNRVLLHDRIDHSIVMAHRAKRKLALMFLDLNRFKAVNDRLGHAVGDKLLKQVAQRLNALLREGDTVCRNGGDEFIILMESISHDEDIAILAQKIVKDISTTFLIETQEVNIGVSIGISIYPDNGNTHTELIKNADTAMYRAKEENTVSYEFYTHSMSVSMMERVKMEAALHQALAKNEFYLVYQPKVDIQKGQTIGFEALLRWDNSEFGFVSPAKFIPILESSSLINEVGHWIIHDVVEKIKHNTFQDLMISINLSPVQFRSADFIQKIRTEFKNSQISPSQVEFEVTESLMIDNFNQSQEKLRELRSLGCSVALDDFGTGYSSLSYLTQLPIDVLKVDRSFIINIHKHAQQQAMLQSIMYMTKKLHISTVIEGVEIEDELQVIQQLGGAIIQGYYFSKPLKEFELTAWLIKPIVNITSNT